MADAASRRQANFELLRIVAMLMIIALHYLIKGNFVDYTGSGIALAYVARLLEAFCLTAVNCYVLISGYFLVESEWKPGRVASLLAQILFYSVLIPVIAVGIASIYSGGIPWEELRRLDFYDWLGFLLPIETEHYWFATAYLLMYLFAPVLAAGVKNMEKKTLQKVILFLLFFFSVGKSVVPVSLVTDRQGYDYGWFLCLFLIAAYLRLYGCQWLEEKKHAVLLYVGMCFCIFAVSTIVEFCAERTDWFAATLHSYAQIPYTYNHLLCLLGSVGLFFVFKNMKIREGKPADIIRRLAPYTFGVYLFHEHILIRYSWLDWLQVSKVLGSWLFLPYMIGCILAVYLVGTLVDFVRARIFDKIFAVSALYWKERRQ